MQTKREYAASLGLAIAGARGKFSNAAKEAIAKAEAEGMRFADSPTAAPVKAGPAVTKTERAAPKSAPVDSLYVSPSDFRFPEAEYKAVGTDGKTYGMRECCNTCRVSLTNHACDYPTIHGNMAVTIRGRR